MPIQIYLDGVNLITSCFASVKVGVQVRGKKSSRSTYQRRHTANYHSTTTLPDHTTLEEGRPPATFSVPWELLTPALSTLSLTCNPSIIGYNHQEHVLSGSLFFPAKSFKLFRRNEFNSKLIFINLFQCTTVSQEQF